MSRFSARRLAARSSRVVSFSALRQDTDTVIDPHYLRPLRHARTALSAAATVVAACAGPASDHATRGYVPRTRALTVTTVPLLVKEQQSVLPFLKEDFAKGGVLDGKEVYAFSPSTITVVEGDTIHLTLINPEDDTHSFVLPDFVVPLPGNKRIDTTYVAKRAGIFPIVCAVASHLPMM